MPLVDCFDFFKSFSFLDKKMNLFCIFVKELIGARFNTAQI